jgi:hypothetical protein
MASNESSNATPTPQLSAAELSALASRLRARAKSVILRDQPEQQRDLRAAAQVIDQLLQLHAEIRATAAVIHGLSRLLDIVEGR